MYTNELLEEKYKAQQKLAKIAGNTQGSYFDMIEKYVRELYKEKKWRLRYSKRQGGYENEEKRKILN